MTTGIELRIQELEHERDLLLASTDDVILPGSKYKAHRVIKQRYSKRINNLRKYGVEHPMQLQQS